MKLMKFHYDEIRHDDPDDVVIIGVEDECAAAAEVAAAQYRPCILVDAPERYHFTKFEPLYLFTAKHNVLNECIEYCMSFD